MLCDANVVMHPCLSCETHAELISLAISNMEWSRTCRITHPRIFHFVHNVIPIILVVMIICVNCLHAKFGGLSCAGLVRNKIAGVMSKIATRATICQHGIPLQAEADHHPENCGFVPSFGSRRRTNDAWNCLSNGCASCSRDEEQV